MKKKKILLFALAGSLALSVLTGCNGEKPDEPNPPVETPENPDTPSTPENPDTPSTPENPDTPDTPSTPENPDTPQTPTIPDGATTISFGEEKTGPKDTWYYWNDQWWVGSSVVVNAAYVLNNEITVDYAYLENSATNWGLQLFYDNSELTVGKTYKFTCVINSLEACSVNINGTAVALAAGDNNIEVSYVEPADATDLKSSLCFQLDKTADLSNVVVIKNCNWEETISKLPAPEGIVIATEPSDNSKVIQFAAVSNAVSYKVAYVSNETGETVLTEDIAAPGAKLTKLADLEDGIYLIKVQAIADGVEYSDSNVSTTYAYLQIGDTADEDTSEKVNLEFGEETNLPLNKYVYWNDQWWCGSSVTVHEAYIQNNVITVAYEYIENSSTDWGLQIFYKNINLTQGQKYKLALNINSLEACKVKVNGQSFDLVAGDNIISVEYTEGGVAAASLAIQADKTADMTNTIALSNIEWTPVTTGSTTPDTPAGDDQEKVTVNVELETTDGTLAFGEENNLTPNTYAYWNDQWWVGSSVTVHEAVVTEGVAKFDYEYAAESSTDWGMQIFFKNDKIAVGTSATLKLTINSADACKVKVNGQYFDLIVGDNEIEVAFVQGEGASLSIQADKSEDLRNTISLSNVVWSYETVVDSDDNEGETGGESGGESGEGEATKLPAVEGGMVNPLPEGGYNFACAAVTNATTYHIQFLLNEEVVAEQDVTNGGVLTCVANLAAGTYQVKVKAVGDGTSYLDGDYVVLPANFVVAEVSDDEESEAPEVEDIVGEAINIDATQTKIEGAGVMIYLADKPAITVDDITIRIKSFESTQFATYESQILAGATKVHYLVESGYFYSTIANGFPNESDVKMVINISYTLNDITYSQDLTFVGNAYTPASLAE